MVEALICAQNWLSTIITQFDGITANEEFELFEEIFTSTVWFIFILEILL